MLSPKQEKFCQLYVELGNGSEAYRQAYNSTAKPESVHVRASELLSDSKVSVRVDEIREALKANHGITLKNILDELEEARRLALETGTATAAVSASMGKAKLLGFDREKKEQPTAKPFVINFIKAEKPTDAD
jgi:phage terminase small subunit